MSKVVSIRMCTRMFKCYGQVGGRCSQPSECEHPKLQVISESTYILAYGKRPDPKYVKDSITVELKDG